MEILNIKNLSFKYPSSAVNALDSVSLSLENGSFNLLCGESGCGKTTLLKMIKRELSPVGEKSGEVLFFGEDLSSLSDVKSACEIGYVSQNTDDAIVTDTVWRELAFGLENLGLARDEAKRRVAETASFFGIEKLLQKKICELSGGQKQMILLASVMLMHPKLLILDEPTSKLDPIAASDFIAAIRKLNSELGITVIIAEHRIEELVSMADRVIYMEDGRIPFVCRPRELAEKLSKTEKGYVMSGALPGAVRLFISLEKKGDSPLTVNEGRIFVSETYKNSIRQNEIPSYTHSDTESIRLEEVSFRYSKNSEDVLSCTDLTVYKGERFFILGGNGVGKTTLLSVISGLRRPYRGKVFVEGKRLSEYKSNSLYRGVLASLPQDPYTLFLKSSVKEDLCALLSAFGIKGDEAERRINAVCAKMKTEHLLSRHPFDLSGGEIQKCALAKVLLTEPKVILLDEPTKGYDANSKAVFAEILRELKNDGITTVTVSHDIEFAAENADRCAMLFGGEIISPDIPEVFFSENYFYTTSANRMARGSYDGVVTVDALARMCNINGEKE